MAELADSATRCGCETAKVPGKAECGSRKALTGVWLERSSRRGSSSNSAASCSCDGEWVQCCTMIGYMTGRRICKANNQR